jgi:hypothetical protein
MRTGTSVLLALAVAPWAACSTPDDSVYVGRAAYMQGPSALMQDSSDCGSEQCSPNASTVGDGVLFDEVMAIENVPNRNGVAIVRATIPVPPIHLDDPKYANEVLIAGWDVNLALESGNVLTAVDKVSGQVWRGKALEGLVVRMQDMRPSSPALYEILLTRVHVGCDADHAPNCDSTARFWAAPQYPLEYYEFKARTVSGASRPDDPADDGPPAPGKFRRYICGGDELRGLPDWQGIEYAAIAFAGDRYAADHTVSESDPHGPLFNLACAGTAMAKMHLLRHTQVQGEAAMRQPLPVMPPSDADRQAMLRMLTADYCGDGSTYTNNGHPLIYNDANHWFPAPGRPVPQIPLDGSTNGHIQSFEAVWGPGGAICIDTPRKVPLAQIPCVFLRKRLPSRPLAAPGGASSLVPIELRNIPSCSSKIASLGGDWTKVGHVASVNPVLTPPPDGGTD